MGDGGSGSRARRPYSRSNARSRPFDSPPHSALCSQTQPALLSPGTACLFWVAVRANDDSNVFEVSPRWGCPASKAQTRHACARVRVCACAAGHLDAQVCCCVGCVATRGPAVCRSMLLPQPCTAPHRPRGVVSAPPGLDSASTRAQARTRAHACACASARAQVGRKKGARCAHTTQQWG